MDGFANRTLLGTADQLLRRRLQVIYRLINLESVLMITTQHTQEALSRAYIIALAAQAGANYELGRGFDYGVDCTLRHVEYVPQRRRHVETGFSIEIQLKSSTLWSFDKNNDISYNLESKTWNDLVDRDPAAIPLYLGLLCLPKNNNEWISADASSLVLKHCCYFFRPTETNLTRSSNARQIHIPRANLLNGEAIKDLLHRARIQARGGAP